MNTVKIFNGFGITPTKNFTAAGYDFYIPVIDSSDKNTVDTVYRALSKSYNKTIDELNDIYDMLSLFVNSCWGTSYWHPKSDLNILHLFLALDAPYKIDTKLEAQVDEFVNDRLVFNNVPGIMPQPGDYLLLNSGIKTKFDHEYAGIFMNKSGKGTKGWDVRACVVDEDYTGYVHMSLAYDKEDNSKAIIYCGDKISQMLVIKVPESEIVEISETEFENAHNMSKRGDNGFGSSDVVR